MVTQEKSLTGEELATAVERRRVAMHLQEIESNPLDADEIAMFEMFEREGWSHERRRAFIIRRVPAKAMTPAAE